MAPWYCGSTVRAPDPRTIACWERTGACRGPHHPPPQHHQLPPTRHGQCPSNRPKQPRRPPTAVNFIGQQPTNPHGQCPSFRSPQSNRGGRRLPKAVCKLHCHSLWHCEHCSQRLHCNRDCSRSRINSASHLIASPSPIGHVRSCDCSLFYGILKEKR